MFKIKNLGLDSSKQHPAWRGLGYFCPLVFVRDFTNPSRRVCNGMLVSPGLRRPIMMPGCWLGKTEVYLNGCDVVRATALLPSSLVLGQINCLGAMG